MSEMANLIRRLRRNKGPRTGDELLAQQLESWTNDVHALMSTLRSWLAPGEVAGVFLLEDIEETLAEEDFGQYSLPALAIRVLTTPPRQVRVLPRGLSIVGLVDVGQHRLAGARGRVDLVCGPARAMMLRIVEAQTTWKVITRTGPPSSLDADVFARVISELVE